MSRSTLVALDTVSLIHSALDDQQYRWLQEAGAVAQLWEASVMVLTTLENTFVPDRAPDRDTEPDQQTRELWGARYRAALLRLRHAGIQVTTDGRCRGLHFFSKAAGPSRHQFGSVDGLQDGSD